MIIICVCGKEFKTLPCRIKPGKVKHCSRECFEKHKPRNEMKNKYVIVGDITTLEVKTKDIELYVCIDTDDLERLIDFGYSWTARKDKYRDCYYICCNATLERGRKKAVPLHRFIISATEGLVVDHINGNTLDNRKNNLRMATKAENGQNRVNLAKNNTSGVRGVTWHKTRKRWMGSVVVNQKAIHVGFFDDIETARIAVEQVRAHHMPFSQEAMSQQL